MKSRVFVFFLLFFVSAPAFANEPLFPLFSDLPTDHPHFSAITDLKNEGVLNGYKDGSFKPDQTISRAETLKILLLGSKIAVPQSVVTKPFPDIEIADWFAVYIEEAKKLSIVSGRGNGNFEPYEGINRAEALKMLILVNGITPKTPEKNPHADVPFDTWYAPYFSEAKRKGVFDAGDDDNVEPAHILTRGELAEMMYRYKRYDEQRTIGLVGIASWYGGREEEGMSVYTAAHPSREKGSKIKVTDVVTGKSVVVRINDRGPFLPGRILDLSRPAFEHISDLGKGVTLIEIEDIAKETPEGPWSPSLPSPEKNPISLGAWEGITLSSPLLATVRKGETKVITGKAIGNMVTAFFTDPQTKKEKKFSAPIQNGSFSLPLFFENTGTLQLGILVGESGSAKTYPIIVTDAYQVTSSEELPLPTPKNLKMSITEEGKALLDWDDDGNNIFHIQIRQKFRVKNLFVSGDSQIVIPREVLQSFTSGEILIAVAGASSVEGSSLHLKTPFGGKVLKSFVIIPSFPQKKEDGMSISSFSRIFTPGKAISLSGKSSKPLGENATIILPNGEIITKPLKISGENFSLQFDPSGIGTHVIEISGSDGQELLTVSASPEGFIPLLPNPQDFGFLIPSTFEYEKEKNTGIDLINAFRQKNGLPTVRGDNALHELAQFRADDMVKRKYFSHISPDGTGADDIRLHFTIKTPVEENIGTGESIESVSFGLETSATHRQLLLKRHVSRVGVGIAVIPETKERVVVQIFAGEDLTENDLAGIRTHLFEIIAERRGENAVLSNIELEGIGNSWSNVMANKGDHAFSFASGEDIEDFLRKGGVTKESFIFVGQFLRANDTYSFFKNDKESLNHFFEGNTHEMGIGLAISPEGILFITAIGTE